MAGDPLLQPFRLRHLELKNRVISTAHEPAYSDRGMPADRYRAYHLEKARGGIAMSMIGGSAIVAPDSPPAFGNLDISTDRIIPHFAALAEDARSFGMAVMCQITHLGRRTSNYAGDWLPVLAPSCVREPAHRAFPKVAESFDIERVIRSYGQAARRCRAGGLDGVELQAYGHLLDSFWSPLTNRRDDTWGGTFENRVRFAEEILSEVRREVSGDYIVGIRMVFDEARPGGLSRLEGMEIGRRLLATGGLDFVNVIVGHIDTDEGLSHVIANMGTPAAPQLDLCGEIRAALGAPTIHANRINDVASARHAIREEKLDLVGMTRAHLADPHIVAKIERGEEHRIRPCIGAGYCIDRIYEGADALCIHNPSTGRELTLPHITVPDGKARHRVVVVGAGPAGLEAARVCALRGHDVVLMEADSRIGGQVKLAAIPERRRELIGIVDWLGSEIEVAGVELRLNCLADVETVLAEAPDVVVIATGGLPNTNLPEEGADLVTSIWDVLGGGVRREGEIILFDDNGQHPGVSCAEHLSRDRAVSLEIVTPERMIGRDIGGTNYPAYLKAFYERGVTITPDHHLVGVTRTVQGRLRAHLYNDYTKARTARVVDHVIVEHGTLPLDDLYLDLKPKSSNDGALDHAALLAGAPQRLTANRKGRFRLFRVGDAVASRNIHAAVYDARRLCQSL